MSSWCCITSLEFELLNPGISITRRFTPSCHRFAVISQIKRWCCWAGSSSRFVPPAAATASVCGLGTCLGAGQPAWPDVLAPPSRVPLLAPPAECGVVGESRYAPPRTRASDGAGRGYGMSVVGRGWARTRRRGRPDPLRGAGAAEHRGFRRRSFRGEGQDGLR